MAAWRYSGKSISRILLNRAGFLQRSRWPIRVAVSWLNDLPYPPRPPVILPALPACIRLLLAWYSRPHGPCCCPVGDMGMMWCLAPLFPGGLQAAQRWSRLLGSSSMPCRYGFARARNSGWAICCRNCSIHTVCFSRWISRRRRWFRSGATYLPMFHCSIPW